LDINNTGQIVGGFGDASGVHGFLISDGIFTAQIDVPGASFTEVFGINDTGQIVGEFQFRPGNTLAFLATPNPEAIPEPSTWLLLGSGFVVWAFARRKLLI
jgi:probable HAF family extracellular repeat protein